MQATTRFRSKPTSAGLVSDQYSVPAPCNGRDTMDVEWLDAIAAGLKVEDQTTHQHLQHDTVGYDKIENSSDNAATINNYKW